MVVIYRKTLSGERFAFLRYDGRRQQLLEVEMSGSFSLLDGAKSFSPAGSGGSGRPLTSRSTGWLHWLSIVAVAIVYLLVCVSSGSAQTSGNSSLSGVVSDPTGAVVPGATVEIHNPV